MGVNGIYGLSGSGLDIESMVKVGMMGKQSQYDKMQQKYTQNEWKKTEYLSTYGTIQTFNNSTLSQYKMSNTMNARSADSSNESAVKTSANATAANMTHYVEVGRLASAAYLIGNAEGGIKSHNAGDKTSINLQDALFSSLRKSNNTYTDTDDSYLEYTDANGNTSDVKATDVAFSFSLSDGTKGEEIQSTNENVVTISVTYQQLADGYSFNDLASAINGANTNVRASYDSVQDQFTIYNKESGADNKVSLTMATGTAGTNAANFFDKLALKSSANGELSATALDFAAGGRTAQPGENAIAKIDGVDYTNLSSNKTTVNGVIYEFKDTTSVLTSDGKVDSANGTKVTVSVTQDADAIVDKVKSFVEDYNKLLADLYKKYDEKPNSNYKPLTESQKNAMTEEQITKWEEKAKAGMLYHDKELGDLITKMRSAVSEKVEGISSKYDTIFALGISTTGVKGQLTLDEDKLRSALADDPDAVYNVFAKLDKDDNYSGNGIAQRLGDVFTSSMKRIKSVSGSDTGISEDSDLNNLLRELQTKMSNFKKLMSSFEEQLYKKYDAMESSLSLLGTQLNYVTSSFS